MIYVYLFLSIGLEVIGTTLMKKTEGFTNLSMTILVLLSYGLAFYFLSLTLKSLPVGIVYATWSGVGIVLVSAIAYFVYQQSLNWQAIVGLALIIAGVITVNLHSGSPH